MAKEMSSAEKITKTKLLQKLIMVMGKNGFQTLKMEDIARYMDVSRATMYKYFSSKEEVLAGVVDVYIDYLDELALQTSADDSDTFFADMFQQLYRQALLLSATVMNILLKELQISYLELYERLGTALAKREQQIVDFYQAGMASGVFHQLNARLIFLQDEATIRQLLDTKYLIAQQLSLSQVLYDYYQLKKIQLFKPDQLAKIDDSPVTKIIEFVVHKFNNTYH